MEILISYDLWDDICIWSYQLIENNDVADDIKNYAQLLSAYSKLLTKDRKNVVDALAIFESLVENDVQNNLYYSQYIGAIGCAVALQDNIKVKQYFDRLPVNGSVQDLNVGPDCIIEVDFVKIYNPIFDEVSKLFINDKKRKLKNDCLRALYLYSSYEMFEKVRYTKKHINDLKRFYKSNSDNLAVGCAIFNMECAVNLFYQAYLTYMDMLNHNLNTEENYASADTAIDNCSDEELDNIYMDVCEKIDNDFDMDISILVTEIVDSIIDRYWGGNEKKRKFQKIVGMSEKIDILYLEKSNRLFQIAYSFAENNNPKAKRIYEILLKKQPNNASAMNNLGVIYEQDGNLF
jgi:tetratricopeptide (TPR) repeat protein